MQALILIKIFFLVPVFFLSAQTFITEEEAVRNALENHPQMKVSDLEVQQQEALKGQSVNIPGPELLWQAPTGNFYTPGILVAAENPAVYVQQVRTQKAQIALAEAARGLEKNKLVYGVRYTYNELQYLIEKERLLERQDSLFSDLLRINEVRYKVGDITNLEKINSETKYRTIHYSLMQTRAQRARAQRQLGLYMGLPDDTAFLPGEQFEKYEAKIEKYDTTLYRQSPVHDFYLRRIQLSNKQLKLARTQIYPGFVAGYLNQGTKESPVKYRFQFGFTLPVFFWTYTSRIQAARNGVEIAEGRYELSNYQLRGQYAQAVADFRQYEQSLNYFETTGTLQSAELMKAATGSYRAGEIGYFAFLQTLDQVFSIEMAYLDALKGYNQSLIYIDYLSGDQKF